MKKSIALSVIVFFFLSLSPVTAANATQTPVTLTIDDILTEINPYGVSAGDTFEWLVEYDETKIFFDGTDEWLTPFADSSLQINGAIGTFSFNINNIFYYPLYPALHFSGGSLNGFFMMYVLDPPYVNLMSMDQYLFLDADNNTLYSGSFIFGTAPVPEPSTFILLLAGLVCFAGFKIMKRR